MHDERVRGESNTRIDRSTENALMAELGQNAVDTYSTADDASLSDVLERPVQIAAGHPSTRSKTKCVIDIVISASGLLLLTPLFSLIAVLIKMDSAGPVIFRQKRVGLNGTLFDFYKFRSMHNDCSSKVHKKYIRELIHGKRKNKDNSNAMGNVFKLTADERITRVGRVLRRTSLDELPQLFNVLKGDMSLVGPRPAIGYEVEMYKDWYTRRLSVLPGITGLWQISGRSERTFDEMVELDLQYIDNWSLLRDLNILWRTIFVVLKRQGAW